MLRQSFTLLRLPLAVMLALTTAAALPRPALADANLARSRNCVACHAVDKKLIGPAYRDIAARYATDKAAVERLARKVREGSTGAWGQVPMPANPQVNEAEAAALITWILRQKK